MRFTNKSENVSLNVCTRTLSMLSVRAGNVLVRILMMPIGSERICDHREDYAGRAPGSHQRELSSRRTRLGPDALHKGRTYVSGG
jgi:hypothetical protein